MFGLAGTVLTVSSWLFFRQLHAPDIWYWGLTAPASAAALGFLQAYLHFCADFGLRGVFNLDKTLTMADTPIQAQYRIQDRTKALNILAASIGIGLLVGAVAVWIA